MNKAAPWIIILVIVLVLSCCCCCWLTGVTGGGGFALGKIAQQPTATAMAIQLTYTPLPTQAQPTAVPPVPTLVPPTAVPPQPTAEIKTVAYTCEGDTRLFAEGAVLFPSTIWNNDQPKNDCHYDVVYDPGQSGYAGVEPKGWWYQPWLPGPHREYHEVALIAKPGLNWFLGPECRMYWNNSGTDATALKNGKMLIDKSNTRVELTLTATDGHPNETWLFVTCDKSDASGFSISLIDPAP